MNLVYMCLKGINAKKREKLVHKLTLRIHIPIFYFLSLTVEREFT